MTPEQLAAAVRVAAAGEAVLQPSVTRKVVEAFTTGRAEITQRPGQAITELTGRGLEVFRLPALAKSNADIASTLYISEATAKTRVARILTKLNLRGRAQAAVRAFESSFARPGW